MAILWTVKDRYHNQIYFTAERWSHILASRPELEPYLALFRETLRIGLRRQDPYTPSKYRYYQAFDELLPDNSHLIVIVLFKMRINDNGEYVSNNFVVTA